MMYPFMTLDDGTEIVHSEMMNDNTVKVYIEKPDEKDCIEKWKNFFGEVNYYC